MVEAGQADYWAEACEAFRDAGDEDAYSLAEAQAKYKGLDEGFACNWVVAGMTRADWNRLQAFITDFGGWAADLMAKYRFMQGRLRSLSAPPPNPAAKDQDP